MIVRQSPFAIFEQTILREGHDFFGKVEIGFSGTIMLKRKASSSNSAAGRDGHGARDYSKDGRHPKHQNHGRIAGR